MPPWQDSLAQLEEHNTFNVGVLGSSPRRITREPRPSKVLALTFLSHTFTCGETCLEKILYRLRCRAAAMRGIPKTNSHRDGGEG